VELIRLNGNEARQYADDLASLRLKVFWEYPYLYAGNPEYEKKYLETYFRSQHSFILLIKDSGKIIGATTSILASEEEPSFSQPLIDFGYDLSKVFYYGESVLLPEYRGKGLGKIFFQEREAFARSLKGIKTLSFCAVVREDQHPLRPPGYQPLNEFWHAQGFSLQKGLTTQFEWPDRDKEISTSKTMQFWTKEI
jgi:GNAT superfamily N-acetyltransferase